MKPVIEVRNLTKRFGNFTAVNDISFDVAKGDFSDSSAQTAQETTAMRMLCGLSFLPGQRYGSRF